MGTPALQKLRQAFEQLEREIDTMTAIAPQSHVLDDLRRRSERVRTALEDMSRES